MQRCVKERFNKLLNINSNVLILDDIEFVGKNLCKRFYETSRFYSKNLGIEIKPHFEVVQIGDCYKNTLEKIKDSIIEK